MSALLRRDVLRYCSYTHSLVYTVLLWAAISGRESIVSVLGWVHGIGWILMSLLCLAAVRRRVASRGPRPPPPPPPPPAPPPTRPLPP